MKKLISSAICVILLFTLTACWNRREPKELGIVNSLIYDITDEGLYELILEIRNPSAGGSINSGGSSKNPFITASGTGASFPEALRDVSSKFEKVIFGGHNKARFFSEKFAKNDMGAVLDFFVRDHIADESPFMVVIKGDDPKKIYSSQIGLSEIVGNYIEALSKSQVKLLTQSVFVTTLDFIKDYYSEGKQPVAGVAELIKTQDIPSDNSVSGNAAEPYNLVYKGLAAFKDNKLAGYFNEIEARAYNIIINDIKSAYLSVPSDIERSSAVLRKSKCGVKTEYKDGIFSFDLDLKVILSLVQEGGNKNLSDRNVLKEIEQKINALLENELSLAIEKAQKEFNSDIFGFGEYVHKKYPKIWKEIKKNWDDCFVAAKFTVKADTFIVKTGEIRNSVRSEELL